MKIVCIADTHGQHEQVDLPDGDVLIHAGDFTHFGDGRDKFLHWFESQSFDHKLIILGNHEDGGLSQIAKQKIEGELTQRDGITFIGLESVSIDGLRFGSNADQDLDVLVTHQPPDGILDRGKRKHWPKIDLTSKAPGSKLEHLGSPAVRQLVKRTDPAVHIFGHIHKGYGRIEQDGVTYINCALCVGEDYELVNEPFVKEHVSNLEKD